MGQRDSIATLQESPQKAVVTKAPRSATRQTEAQGAVLPHACTLRADLWYPPAPLHQIPTTRPCSLLLSAPCMFTEILAIVSRTKSISCKTSRGLPVLHSFSTFHNANHKHHQHSPPLPSTLQGSTAYTTSTLKYHSTARPLLLLTSKIILLFFKHFKYTRAQELTS